MRYAGLPCLAFVIAVTCGCEPPPVAEQKSEAKPVAKQVERPSFAPRATIKPNPSPTAKPAPTVVVMAAPAAPPPKRLAFSGVELPGGRTLTSEMLFLDRRRVVMMFPTVNVFYFMEGDAKEQLTGAFAFSPRDGKWNGSGIAFREDHASPRFVAQFTNAVRDGGFWGWSPTGGLDYWSEYRKGRRQGLTVLVKKREPVLVQDWHDNQLKAQYLVELVDNKEFKAREVKPSDGALDEKMRQYTAELKLLDEKYLEEEKVHRRHFVEWNNTRTNFEEYARITRTVDPNSPGKREETRRRQEFDNRQRRLFETWQFGFWKMPL